MDPVPKNKLPSEAEMASYGPAQFIALVQTLGSTIQSLQHQLEWFQRQMFGTKSERLRVLENAQQLALGEVLAAPPQTVPAKERLVATHTRREPQRDAAVGEADSVPFFDEARVPVETIELLDPQVEGLSPDEYEVISQKVSYRLAQRPGSYVILKYLRSVTKRVDTQAISCAPAPTGVIDGSRADVSFVAGLLVDKFSYYLPLYRQHQRLQDSGIDVSRPWLTQLSQRSISLLEPVYDAQFDSIRASRVKAMDETPIKAGRKERGKMKIGYFWPVYGENNEVCFPFFLHVKQKTSSAHSERSMLQAPSF
jgi:transposase